MPITGTIKAYLEHKGVDFDIVTHPHTTSSLQTMEVAHIDGRRIAKGVVLKDQNGFLLAVLPATRNLDLQMLENQIGRRMDLADEKELGSLFPDCQLGAVPALGLAYGIPTLIDEALLSQPEIYFEAGNHEELIHLRESEFEKLMEGAEYQYVSHIDPE